MNLLGALPARFRRERVLIVGCGDVGLRAARELGSGRRARLLALTSSEQRRPELRRAGITPLLGDLDRAASLQRLGGLATRVVHLAPPPSHEHANWREDPRTRQLLRALARRGAPASMVYGSTSGVYGDRQGDWVDESMPVSPGTPRAWRRVDAERWVHAYGRASGARTVVLRIPGIYASDRDGGTPRARLQRGTPVLRPEDDVYTNHIHADDLARACALALWRGRPRRTINVVDDTELRMGDYFDLAADLYGLPRPPRIGRSEAQAQLPLALLSFMGESRRLHNRRMKRELRLQLRYPTVSEGLRA
ncbi:MAG TPA: SDR family oxidoreductase [Hydrogenophaga sp.]|uniref:SDR family oxidoreductase n=1 Tax=Hydrogenophaga sp. TaxID=1904254 RepID=UPI002CFB33F6|nr:SDR family oxidoreductase [Hydrogenophaga sp.]HMN94429.1 SDR family oxidoreductase [Hydrogenophaga sp.]HMP09375.1 SDR family oxidoreductase [Hydrogenophaga sp.]